MRVVWGIAFSKTNFSLLAYFLTSAKPKITYVENKTAMELEDQITLTCEASGDPIPSITWRTSTRNISNEEKVVPPLRSSPQPYGVGRMMEGQLKLLLFPLHMGSVMLHTESMTASVLVQALKAMQNIYLQCIGAALPAVKGITEINK